MTVQSRSRRAVGIILKSFGAVLLSAAVAGILSRRSRRCASGPLL